MAEAPSTDDLMRRLRTLVQSASHMLVVMGLDRTILWVNQAWETRTGYGLDTVRGHNPGKFLRCADTGPEVGPTLRREMEAGRRVRVDMLCGSIRGERYWLDIDVQPTYGPDGAVDGFVAVHTDITDRKIQEQAAIAARNRLQATLNAMPDIVAELGGEGRFIALHANDSDLPMQPPSTLIGQPLEAVLRPDVAALGRAIMAEVDATGEVRGHRYSFETENGARWFELSAAARPPETPGGDSGYVVVARDISGLHEAEAALREANTRYDLAVTGSLMAIWDNDIVRQELYFSPRLNEIIGGPPGDWVGPTADFMDRLHPEDRARIEAATGHHLSTDEPYNQDMRVRDERGGYVHVRVRGKAIRDETGRAVRIVGITQDLTERKAAELRLKELLDAAEAASAAKSQFLANMSHEIRTPLNGVLGMAQLMELTALDPRQRSYVETIRTSGRALQAVIEDILDISRIEAGKLTLSPEPALTGAIVVQALAAVGGQAARKGLEIITEIDPALERPVEVDPQRLAQVLTNLMSNAVKFTQHGQVTVRGRALADGWIRLEVQDTGPGLDRALQVRVFERFSQADMSPSRAHGGAGLGLAIARELTELAGGRIGVESEPGHGALFWVEQPAPPCGPVEPTLTESPTPPPPGPARRVLVVEDNPVNRAVAAGMLNEAGFVVCEAECAVDALDHLRAGTVDAVLLDLHMPGMSGDEALRRIRAGEAGPADVPVFIVTADVTKDTRERLDGLGADRFFAKPVDGQALVNALRARLTDDAA